MNTWEGNYLAHHGIKGQQWGVRRFQNEDGSLTEEGRKRYLAPVTEDNGTKWQGLTKEGDREFFKKQSSKLTKEGEHVLKDSNVDPELKKAVESLRFERNYSENWTKSWNGASDIFNVKINDINKKYGNDPIKDEQTFRKYISDVNNMWKKTYKDVLLSEFGDHPAINKEWMSYAVGYSNYDNADNFINDEMRRKWAGHKT